jgi:hypothetical protein
LRIQDVYPDPGSSNLSIPDPGSLIWDLEYNKEEEKIGVLDFFVAKNITKLKIILFLNRYI